MNGLFGIFGGEGEDGVDVEHQSGFSRLCNSVIGAVCVAPLLIIISMIVLGWNERRAVCQAKAIFAGKAEVTEVGCGSALAGSGDLVMFSCDIDNNSLPVLSPPAGTAFVGSLSIKSPGLKIESSMLQCVESEHRETQKNRVGGGTTTVITYTYSKAWREGHVNSAAFHAKTSQSFRDQCGADNPQWPSQVPTSQTIWASRLLVGAFAIGSDHLIERIPLDTPVAVSPVPSGWTSASGGTTYETSQFKVASTGAAAGIGSVRVGFMAYDAQSPTLTLLGKNSGGQIAQWTAPDSWLCSGFTLEDLRVGRQTKDQVFKQLESENSFLTWLLRIIGFAMFWIAFCLVAGPLGVLADCIPCVGPCLGDAVSAITTCIACLPATACTLGVAGVVWVAMRPMVGGPMIAIFFCCSGGFAGFKVYSKMQGGDREYAGDAELVGRSYG